MRPRQSDMPVVPTNLDAIPSKLNATSGRPAAVLVGLTLQDNGWHVIMTERSAHLAHHAGQISFPGGKVEEGDHGLVATGCEAGGIALSPDQVDVIGGLGPVTSLVGFIVQPVAWHRRVGNDPFRLSRRSGADTGVAVGGSCQFLPAPPGELHPRRATAQRLAIDRDDHRIGVRRPPFSSILRHDGRSPAEHKPSVGIEDWELTMRRYIILATAILAAILVMSLIKAWQARRAKARGEEVQSGAGIGFEHIAGALVGLAVFFAGVMFLESDASKPGTKYQPAQIKDGRISSGDFTTSSTTGD